MKSFSAKIYIIGVNPYIVPPEIVLNHLFKISGKEKGPIPIRVTLGKKTFIQTLVKFKGKWQLYLNMSMRRAAGKDVGNVIKIKVEYDPMDRNIQMHPKLQSALKQNKTAENIFNGLIPSRKKEIIRYIRNLKSEEAVERNVKRAIQFLMGNERFVGRDKP